MAFYFRINKRGSSTINSSYCMGGMMANYVTLPEIYKLKQNLLLTHTTIKKSEYLYMMARQAEQSLQRL
jgi:hypothetical protein